METLSTAAFSAAFVQIIEEKLAKAYTHLPVEPSSLAVFWIFLPLMGKRAHFQLWTKLSLHPIFGCSLVYSTAGTPKFVVWACAFPCDLQLAKPTCSAKDGFLIAQNVTDLEVKV